MVDDCTTVRRTGDGKTGCLIIRQIPVLNKVHTDFVVPSMLLVMKCKKGLTSPSFAIIKTSYLLEQ